MQAVFAAPSPSGPASANARDPVVGVTGAPSAGRYATLAPAEVENAWTGIFVFSNEATEIAPSETDGVLAVNVPSRPSLPAAATRMTPAFCMVCAATDVG